MDAKGIAYTARDIKEERPTYAELKAWHAMSGLPLRRLFNTSGQQYRAQGLKDRLPDIDEEAQLRLLATDGMLVKRPLLVLDGRVLVGYSEPAWEEALRP